MSDQEQPATGGTVNVAHEPTGCDGWIPGVPKTVPRARIAELIEALGLDVQHLRGLRIEPHAVYAEVYALKDGGRFWDGAWQPDSQPARHRFAIPIVDSVPEQAPEVCAQFAPGGLISDTCRSGVEEPPKFGVTVDPGADPGDVGRKVVDAIREYDRRRGDGPEPQPA
ncbi:hypothetical protein [Nonomuraea sp. KM90]|uniref:hypothetical protein n=1 Tax=Nonomuraea sp. KM90 TaxID=3457428 RepID=UPI003FCDF2D5